MSSGPKPAFYLIMALLLLGLVGYGVYRFQERSAAPDGTQISADDLRGGIEAPDDASLTTFK